MSGPMNNDVLTTHSVDGVIVVSGDIDIAGSPILEAAIHAQESAGELVTIDLADVYFIDSSGLRCLLAASRRARSTDTKIVLTSVGPEVLRLLEITGTTEQFEIASLRG